MSGNHFTNIYLFFQAWSRLHFGNLPDLPDQPGHDHRQEAVRVERHEFDSSKKQFEEKTKKNEQELMIQNNNS
jgi:hypothetical protein